MSLTISGESGGGDFLNWNQVSITEHATVSQIWVNLTKNTKAWSARKKRIHLGFEITEAVDPSTNIVMMEDGRPFGAFKTYTASTSELSTLRKHVESWRGKSYTDEEVNSFDITQMIGCTVKIEIGLTKE